MKNLILALLSFPLISQEIVNETINTQVESSQASAELQIKIDELDVESKKIYFEYILKKDPYSIEAVIYLLKK